MRTTSLYLLVLCASALLAAPVGGAPFRPIRAVSTRPALARVTSGKVLPAIGRRFTADLAPVVHLFRAGKTKEGTAAWAKVSGRMFNKGNKGQAGYVIAYVAYQAHVAPRPRLAQIVDRYHFYDQLRQAIALHRTRLIAARRGLRKGQTVEIRTATFNRRYRPGVTALQREGSLRADETELARRLREMEELADQVIQDAKQAAKDAEEQFKQVWRLIEDHTERMAQTLRATSP